MNTYFIGDTHFGHANILKFEPYFRSFGNIEEHDEALIENWNKVVNPKDIVYHLGDVVFGQSNFNKLGRLNGDKRLIMGNHDCYCSDLYRKYFTKVYGCLQYNGNCVLSHIPVNTQQLENRFKYNIHGHLHSKNVMKADDRGFGLRNQIKDLRYINVSCEQINLTPVSWEELKEKYFAE